MAGDDFAWAMNMTEEALAGIFSTDTTSGSQAVAGLLQLRESLRSIPQLHGSFAQQLINAIGRIGVPVSVTDTKLSPENYFRFL
jgi:hypothetical protein